MENKNSELAINVEEARKRISLSRGLMYKAIKTGQIKSIRIGVKRIIIPVAALEEFLQQCGSSPSGENDKSQHNKPE